MSFRTLRNYSVNLGAPLILILVAIVSVPLYIAQIGVERYGLITLITTIVGFSGIFDLGLGRTVINSLARVGVENARQRREIIWTALVLNLLLGGVSGVVVGDWERSSSCFTTVI